MIMAILIDHRLTIPRGVDNRYAVVFFSPASSRLSHSLPGLSEFGVFSPG